MNNAALNQVTPNATPASGAKTLIYNTGAWVAQERTATYATGALLQATRTVTYATGAVIQGAGTLFYNTGAYLAYPLHEFSPMSSAIGNGLSVQHDTDQLSSWSTYSRPKIPVDGQHGKNVATGKTEYWNELQNKWKHMDNTDAPTS